MFAIYVMQVDNQIILAVDVTVTVLATVHVIVLLVVVVIRNLN